MSLMKKMARLIQQDLERRANNEEEYDSNNESTGTETAYIMGSSRDELFQALIDGVPLPGKRFRVEQTLSGVALISWFDDEDRVLAENNDGDIIIYSTWENSHIRIRYTIDKLKSTLRSKNIPFEMKERD